MVPARLRSGSDWSDVTICNVSSRGLMGKASPPPAKGEYVELRHRSVIVIGRVVWSQGVRFGLRTQDKIDIAGLLTPASRTPERERMERRQASRQEAARSHGKAIAYRAETSRHIARVLDWGVLALTVAVAAGIVFEMANSSLSGPLRKAQSAMEGRAEEGG